MGINYFALPREKRREMKMLELGCGSGANLWMVAKEGFDAYGIDFSQTGLHYCEHLLKEWGVSANLISGDITNLSFEDAEFDLIFDIVAMQHLSFEQHYQSYKDIYRCLKPKGKFYSYHIGENSISLKSTKEMIDHCTVKKISEGFPLSINFQTCFLSANEVRRALSDIGFKNINIEKIVRSYSDQTMYIEYLSISAEKSNP